MLKDTFFQMFLYRCCDFSKEPPELSAKLESFGSVDWSRCFLALQLLPIDSSLTLLRRNKKEKEFCAQVETAHQGQPKMDAVKAAVKEHAEAEIEAMGRRLERKQVTQKDFDEAKRKCDGTISSLPRQDWCTVFILSRQVIAHDSTRFDFHFCAKLGEGLITDFGTQNKAQEFLDTCKGAAQQMLS